MACWSAVSCCSIWAMAWASAVTRAEATEVAWRAASTWSCSRTSRWADGGGLGLEVADGGGPGRPEGGTEG